MTHNWDSLCNQTGEAYGKSDELTGNAQFAREVRDTPLTAEAMLKLVWDNIEYFGDRYYVPLTAPIEWRMEEYLETLK